MSNIKKETSIFMEVVLAIVGFLCGDISSKIGWSILSMLIGILILTRPIMDGNDIKETKSLIHYILGFALIIFSIALFISWLRKRNATNTP